MQSSCRKFTIADAMILVAATAVGLTLCRLVMSGIKVWPQNLWLMLFGQPLLACWSLALLGIRLRNPRPAIAPLFRELGAAASLVTSVTLMMWSLVVGLAIYWERSNLAIDMLALCGLVVGPSVFGIWITLVINRTAVLDPGWIDRSGRILGVAWIFMINVIIRYGFR